MLLGGLRVTTSRGPLAPDQIGGHRNRVVLSVLAIEHGRSVGYDELSEALWPSALPSTWRSALRTAITGVRGMLRSAGWIDASLVVSQSSAELCLPDRVGIDVHVARDHVRRMHHAARSGDVDQALLHAQHAVEMLEQPLLPGDHSPWVDHQRDRLHHDRVAALDVLMTTLLERGDTSGAADAARQVIAIEPLRESAHHTLMLAQMAHGDRAAALRSYEHCRRTLVEELGVDPSPPIQHLYLQLLAPTDSKPLIYSP